VRTGTLKPIERPVQETMSRIKPRAPEVCILLKKAVLRDGDFWQMVFDGEKAKER
jgi:hypothetical protein